MNKSGGRPHGVVAKVRDCDVIVSGFELQSCHYVHLCPWESNYTSYSSINRTNNVTAVLQRWSWN